MAGAAAGRPRGAAAREARQTHAGVDAGAQGRPGGLVPCFAGQPARLGGGLRVLSWNRRPARRRRGRRQRADRRGAGCGLLSGGGGARAARERRRRVAPVTGWPAAQFGLLIKRRPDGRWACRGGSGAPGVWDSAGFCGHSALRPPPTWAAEVRSRARRRARRRARAAGRDGAAGAPAAGGGLRAGPRPRGSWADGGPRRRRGSYFGSKRSIIHSQPLTPGFRRILPRAGAGTPCHWLRPRARRGRGGLAAPAAPSSPCPRPSTQPRPAREQPPQMWLSGAPTPRRPGGAVTSRPGRKGVGRVL
jgi:hypothetical protein